MPALPILPRATSTWRPCRGLPTRFKGVEIKVLMEDKATGLLTALTRFAPGAELPDHEHVEIEQSFVLQGSLVDARGRRHRRQLRVAPGRQPARCALSGRLRGAVVLPEAQQVLRRTGQMLRAALHDHDTIRTTATRGVRFLGSAAAAGASASLPRLGWAAVPQVGDDMAKAAGAWLAQARCAPARPGPARVGQPPPRGLALRAARPAGRCLSRHDAGAGGGGLGRAGLAAQRARHRPGARPAQDRGHAGRADRQPRASAIPATMRW